MDPLLVHHHLPKTAGRSLRKVIQANYGPDELLNLTGKEEGDLERWYRDQWESLPPGRRARVRCVTSHTAQFLLAVIDDRPVRAFCMLREPVERVISLYFFICWIDQHGPSSPMLTEMRRRGWGLKDVYRQLGDGRELSQADAELFWPLFNGQTREVMGPQLDWSSLPFESGGSELEDLKHRALEALSENYVVGVSERFSQSARLFADSFGWRKTFIPQVNVRPYGFHRSEIDEETRSLILAYNGVDAEVHAQHLARVSPLPHTPRRSDLRWRAQQRRRRSVWRARRIARGVLREMPPLATRGRSPRER